MKTINRNLKICGIILGSLAIGLYLLFLIFPFFINSYVKSYTKDIEKIVKDSTGLEIVIKNLGIYTTPVLSVGIKADSVKLNEPDNEISVVSLKNAKGDLKLLPLLFKSVELGKITSDYANVNLSLKKDGSFVVMDYIPQQEEEQTQMTSLPFGLKLSNKLPDLKIDKYKLAFINSENNKVYYTEGENFNVYDFILDKRIKISTKGKLVFDDRVVSNYDIRIKNYIMPDLVLDDIVFPKDVKVEEDNNTDKSSEGIKINLVDIFDAANKNGIKADLNMNVKTSGTFKNPVQRGLFEVNNISVLLNDKQLPDGYLKLLFKGKKTDIDSIFYTSADKKEQTQIIGNITSGKKANIDLTFRSNAQFNNIIRLLDNIAKSFGIKDFETLSVAGGIDADFNIKTDLKSFNSTGYIKIKPSGIRYGLYNLSVDNIVADIDLMNNILNIGKAGFSVMGHPLNLTGSISSDAYADLKLSADRLPIKALLLTAGQISLLKENDINSGSLSLDSAIKGKLSDIKPDVTLKIENVNLFNKPSNAKVILNNAIVKLLLGDNKFSGNVGINNLNITSGGASVSIPKSDIVMDTKDININNTYVLLNKSRIDVKGSVKDYLNENLNMNITASGDLASSDLMSFIPREFHSMFPYKGSMPVKILATGNVNTQNIAFDLTATPSGYVRILNIDKLRGKTTKIHSDIKLSGNSAKLENSGIYAENKSIASFSGGISNLSNPLLNINVSVPENVSFTIPGMNEHSNITANGNVNIGGTINSPKLKGKVSIADISVKDMDFALTNLDAHLNGQGISGNGTAAHMKFGGISASDISAKFSLKDYTNFYLEDIIADCFSGKVNGKLSYNIPNFAFSTDLTGKGLNSMDAVYGAVGIPKALTGTLGFNAKLTGKGVTDVQIIKSLKGNVNFNVSDGRFVSIGKWENLVAAQNVTSNSVLKSAISAMSTVNALQETDKFKTITGDLTMSGEEPVINNIFVTGPLMSYYVKGFYNLLNNSARLNIWGRLDAKIVSYLGPLGQLSVKKLLSYIPGFGTATTKMLDMLTIPPNPDEIAMIPPLSSGSNDYRDFKTFFNGPVEKASSVKSFKWLSVCDTTKMNLAQDGKDAVEAAKNNINSQVETMKNTAQNVKTNVGNIVNVQKQNIETQKQALKQAKQDLKNIKQNAASSVNNLGNILKNAATNANKKQETNSALPESTPVSTQTSAQTQTKEAETQTQTASSSASQNTSNTESVSESAAETSE